MVEDKYVFDDEDDHHVEEESGFIRKLGDMASFIWNSKTKEFCGRDGASWAKISLFYGVFYTVLGGFFIGMLAVFFAVTPKDKPTYYGVSSIMNSRIATLNPGLGFRPQIDPEDHVILYDPLVSVSRKNGAQRHIDALKNFLGVKYPPQKDVDTIDCASNKTYDDEFKQGKSCRFDYKKIFKDTECTLDKDFGFRTPNPCILLKLNKIVSWKPQTGNNSYVRIKCAGESIFDQDNIKKITYYSEDHATPKTAVDEGRISNKYFPFWANNQPSYRAPFIFAVFDVTPNTLINIECKAYADNIDNSDRLNRRGQTKFTLFVEKSKV